MRVIHVINGELYSGAERVQDLLALGLKQLGYEVGFACLKPDKFPVQRVAKDAPLHLVPMKSRFDIRSGLALASIIQRGGYKAIHTHTPRAALVGRIAALRTDVPMIHHVHSPTARDTEHPWRNQLNALIEHWSLRRASRLIPVSKSLERYLIDDGFDAKQICMVPNGVPALGPLPDRTPPEYEWIIGSIALFRPRKGLEILIEAIGHLRSYGRRARLRAVGPFVSPNYEASVKCLAERLGVSDAIDWVGFTDDVNSQYAQMDVFVLPSLYGEGMPMVILEAMAAGVPVIASDVEGTPEVLQHGRSGVIVPPNDALALATALDAFMDRAYDWHAMRHSAWERQRTMFSDHSMVQGVAAVYEQVFNHG